MTIPASSAAVLAAAAIFGIVFWQRPGNAPYAWPNAIPAFLQTTPAFSLEMKNGTSVVSVSTPGEPIAALEVAAAAYRAEGWKELPVKTSDMRLFSKGEAIAAILARAVYSGTCLTAIQRQHGL